MSALYLSDAERAILAHTISLTLESDEALGLMAAERVLSSADRRELLQLRDRIAPDAPASPNGLTRPQELAADGMAARHGRSRVRHLADGAVVIIGMTDDVERETVCINRDGTERWRG